MSDFKKDQHGWCTYYTVIKTDSSACYGFGTAGPFADELDANEVMEIFSARREGTFAVVRSAFDADAAEELFAELGALQEAAFCEVEEYFTAVRPIKKYSLKFYDGPEKLEVNIDVNASHLSDDECVDAIISARFAAGIPRSPEYQGGAHSAINSAIKGMERQACPYPSGTTQADAWTAGFVDGDWVWRYMNHTDMELPF